MVKYSNLGQYGLDIKKYKLLSPAKEKKLCLNILNGDIESRNELITSNLGLVIKIALSYQNMGLQMDDLICEGNKGLFIAAKRFDPSMGNKFSTYAYFWIKQSIQVAIQENNKWSCCSNNNVMNYEEPYHDKDLCVNMNEFEINDNSKKMKGIIKMIDGLPPRDSNIVKHYFGISGFSELNTIELSEKYNITTMRVSSIIQDSIRRIRCKLIEKM